MKFTSYSLAVNRIAPIYNEKDIKIIDKMIKIAFEFDIWDEYKITLGCLLNAINIDIQSLEV